VRGARSTRCRVFCRTWFGGFQRAHICSLVSGLGAPQRYAGRRKLRLTDFAQSSPTIYLVGFGELRCYFRSQCVATIDAGR